MLKNLSIGIVVALLGSCALSFSSGEKTLPISIAIGTPFLPSQNPTVYTSGISRTLLPSMNEISVIVSQGGSTVFEDTVPFSFDYSGNSSVMLEVGNVDLTQEITVSAQARLVNGSIGAHGAMSFDPATEPNPTLNLIPNTGVVTPITSIVLPPGSYLLEPNNYSFASAISQSTALTSGQYSLVIQDSITGNPLVFVADISTMASFNFTFSPGQQVVMTWIPLVPSPTGVATISLVDGGW